MQLYQSIFRESWRVTRRHKVLWLFGLFVLFWGGKGLDIELFFSNARLLGDRLSPFHPEFWQLSHWQTVFQTMAGSTGAGVVMLCLLLAFAFFVILVIMAAQIALIDAFAQFRNEKKGDRYSFDHALRASENNMLPVISVNIIGKAVSYGLLAIASSPLFFAQLQSSKFFYTGFLYLLLMPLVVVISLLTKYAVNAAVLEKKSIMQSWVRSWEVFQKNVGVSIEFAILMFVAFVATNVASILAAALVTMPLFFVGLMVAFILKTAFGLYLYTLFFYVLVVLVAVFTSAVFSAWHFGNWTLLFLELTNGSRRSKIHRLFHGERHE